MKGKDKIPVLLAEKGQELIKQLVPQIIQVATKVGIENIGKLDIKFPDFCLPPDELKKILDIRNNLLDKLNTTTNIILSLSKILDPLNTVVTTTDTALQTLGIVITTTKLLIPTLPTSTPGAPSASSIALNVVDTLQDLKDFLSPKIIKAGGIISSISLALDFVNNILLKLIGILKSIDQYLIGCKVDGELTKFDDYLLKLEQQETEKQSQPQISSSVYKGFILEAVDVVFSPTVKRIKGIAKNNQGIILLQTPPSFTTTPQVLIEELKLIIDSNNLKAY
jgi:hypothetical protein